MLPNARPLSAKVAVVLVNWKGWSDLLECLESLLKQDYPQLGIIICDNGSDDDSLEKLKAWAAGTEAMVALSKSMARWSLPPVRKPLTLAPAGGLTFGKGEDAGLCLIELGQNMGFAGGNNPGLQAALHADADYVWVLNTDTVQAHDALSHLVARLQEKPEAGMCGSVLCYYDSPEIMQEAGGCRYYPLLGLARRIEGDRELKDLSKPAVLEAQLDYVSAASCVVSRAFLEEVGPMCEDYFLYCEEIDWATRARGKFTLALATDSIVYHKKGRATGSKSGTTPRSDASTYYLWRARSRVTRRYYPLGMPGLTLTGFISAAIYTVRGHRSSALATLRGLFDLRRPSA